MVRLLMISLVLLIVADGAAAQVLQKSSNVFVAQSDPVNKKSAQLVNGTLARPTGIVRAKEEPKALIDQNRIRQIPIIPELFCQVPKPVSKADIDPHRSLFVHDVETLSARNFTLRRTLNQIATQVSSSVPGTTAASIFRQLWDTQNTSASAADPSNIHCDDNDSKINGFPLNRCPRPEGKEAHGSDLLMNIRVNQYRPTALVNRVDLAGKGWRNCGEHRIIYAKEGVGIERNLIIFEAVLPNPKPGCQSGCRDVIEFWVNLSKEDNPAVRAAKLETFFYKGITGFRPVVHVNHYNASGASSVYGGSSSGQIRTNQFLQNGNGLSPWTLKEFKTMVSCSSGTCDFDLVPISVKGNPYGPLWNRNIATGATAPSTPIANIMALASNFQSDVLSQVTGDKLANSDINGFSYAVDPNKNAAESQSLFPTIDHYPNQFDSATDSTFRTNLHNAALPFGLTGKQIVNRATALSCAGCHQPSEFGLLSANSIGPGMSWPNTLGFVHVQSHVETLPVNQLPTTAVSSQGFRLSPALMNVFIPARMDNLVSLANAKICPCKVRVPKLKFPHILELDPRRFREILELPIPIGPVPFEKSVGTQPLIAQNDQIQTLQSLKEKPFTLNDDVVIRAKDPVLNKQADLLTIQLGVGRGDLTSAQFQQFKRSTVQNLIRREPPRETVTGSLRTH